MLCPPPGGAWAELHADGTGEVHDVQFASGSEDCSGTGDLSVYSGSIQWEQTGAFIWTLRSREGTTFLTPKSKFGEADSDTEFVNACETDVASDSWQPLDR